MEALITSLVMGVLKNRFSHIMFLILRQCFIFVSCFMFHALYLFDWVEKENVLKNYQPSLMVCTTHILVQLKCMSW